MERSWDPEAVAAKLHDGPVQVVSMVALQLEAIARGEQMTEKAGKIEALATQLRDAAADLRGIISALQIGRSGSPGDSRS